MKIVKFMGGLGNQMFQHAFLVALSISGGDDVYVDLNDYYRKQQHNGYELELIFGIKNKIASKDQIWKYTCLFNNEFINSIYIKLSFLRPNDHKERHSYHYIQDIITRYKEGYYDGFWQCYKYFDKYRDRILKEFSFINNLEGKNDDLIKIIKEQNSVSIHVRRGDYLNSPIYRGLCGIEYYKKAIYYSIEKTVNPIFYIFSNDIEWCKNEIIGLLQGHEYVIVNWNTGKNSYCDMQLMSSCRMNIIANSSFSWWAAYLNQRKDKTVVAPEKWINQPLDYRIQLDDWKTF